VEVPGEVAGQVAEAVTRLYARQSRLIDSGEAAGWAATFTADGEFHSPSYPEPAVGTAALTAFAERFRAAGEETGVVSRHVVTNVDVLPGESDDEAVAHAYLQIVATPRGGDSRLVRLTTLTDRLVRHEDTWLVARRDVRRDDA
jgi:3-phenylpropionate/cinnamic acid dioxygenase small subunit